MWPVGLIPRYGVSSPVLNEVGQVVDFYDSSSTGRMFAVDMASFAFNIQFLLQVLLLLFFKIAIQYPDAICNAEL